MDRKLYLHNSLSGRKEEFVPLKEGKVSLYFCGPTVYADPHIGNFRPVVVFDLLRRVLEAIGYEVTAVSNYTDVDDKIIRRAKELGITERELSDSVIEDYRRLVEEVGSRQPSLTPRPTEMMQEIISYVGDLVEKGAAYVRDGDVYLRVRDIPHYGELSGNSVEELESGARIAPGEKKEDPLDFALWKRTEEGIRWESLWGMGRPGWHTECCVMIDSIFRDQGGLIDIHGGGFDLKFPHHENEIAQARAHNGNSLARYWVHNGFIDIRGEKMSKSLGNVVLMKDVVKEYGGLPFRLMVLGSHYRAPVCFAPETIGEAKKKMEQLRNARKRASILLQRMGVKEEEMSPILEDRILSPLLDDLGSPNALSALYLELKELNASLPKGDKEMILRAYRSLRGGMDVLGLVIHDPVLQEEDKGLFLAYDEARERKDYAESDRLRTLLMAKGLF